MPRVVHVCMRAHRHCIICQVKSGMLGLTYSDSQYGTQVGKSSARNWGKQHHVLHIVEQQVLTVSLYTFPSKLLMQQPCTCRPVSPPIVHCSMCRPGMTLQVIAPSKSHVAEGQVLPYR